MVRIAYRLDSQLPTTAVYVCPTLSVRARKWRKLLRMNN